MHKAEQIKVKRTDDENVRKGHYATKFTVHDAGEFIVKSAQQRNTRKYPGEN